MKTDYILTLIISILLISCNSEDKNSQFKFGSSRVIENPYGTFNRQHLDSSGLIKAEHISFDSLDYDNNVSRYYYKNGILNEVGSSVGGKANGMVVYFDKRGTLSSISYYVEAEGKLQNTQRAFFSPEGYLTEGYLISVKKYSNDTLNIGDNFDVEFAYLNPEFKDYVIFIHGFNHDFTDYLYGPDTVFSNSQEMKGRLVLPMNKSGQHEINVKVGQAKQHESHSELIWDYYKFKVFVKPS